MSNQTEYPHYFRKVEGLTHIDVYRVLALWEITDPAIQHAMKKLFAAGQRGAKDQAQDVREAVASLNRWLQMRQEDIARLPIAAPPSVPVMEHCVCVPGAPRCSVCPSVVGVSPSGQIVPAGTPGSAETVADYR